MNLKVLVSEYLSFRRSLGYKLERTSRHLNTFVRAIGDVNVRQITRIAVRKHLDGTGPLTTNWHKKHQAIKGMFRYAVNRGYIEVTPLPTEVPKCSTSFQAYIYSADEFRRLMAAAEHFGRPQNRFTSLAYQTLLLVLFNTGLRIGEALSLKLGNVDLSENVITVRDGKFHKSRLVPISKRLADSMRRYVEHERAEALRRDPEAPFFAQRNGRPYSSIGALNRFKRLCRRLSIRRTDKSRFSPRVHDIRHSFAISRLLTWYRNGNDVQRLLPQLSTYLGHIDIKSTQHYLTILPELLDEANARFERYALGGRKHG